MRAITVFVAVALTAVAACRGDVGVSDDSRRSWSLPATVNCGDATHLRDRSAQDHRSSSERSGDQEKIDLASRAWFVATLATIADLQCKVQLANADEIMRRALDAARQAQDSSSFYVRTQKWQEAGLMAEEAVARMVEQLPGRTAN